MANLHPLREDTPVNTDDALEGPQRIREIKQAYNERLARDHFIGGAAHDTGTVFATGADSPDTGYHRRITIKEETATNVASSADDRLNQSGTGINYGTTAKMAEIWVEKNSTTNDETSIRFTGTESPATPRTVVTTTQEQTLTNKTMTAPILNDATLSGGAGSIDGVAIGTRAASTGPTVLAGAAAAKFTTLETSSNTIIGEDDTDTLTVKAKTSGLSSDATGGFTGANKMYAGMVGEIRMYAGSAEPEGWIFCDGRSLKRAGDDNYSELFAAIGTTYSGIVGSGGNNIASTDWFRIPNLAGRIPIGKGTGATTATAAELAGTPTAAVGGLGAGSLTERALGVYGADEDHTLTAGESGAGPHYHPVHHTDPGHTHPINSAETWGSPANYLPAWTHGGNTVTPVTESSTTGIILKATHALDTETEDETAAYAASGETEAEFRTNKSNLNPGVPAVSAHTQIQPFVVINYIIKY